MTISYPGGPVCFVGLEPGQEAAVRRHFGPACLESGVAAHESAVVRVVRASRREFRWFDLSGWCYQLEVDHHPHAVWAAGLGFLALLDLERQPLGGVLRTSWPASDDLCGTIENFLRLLASYRALRDGSLILHSGGLADGERACLFPGISGAGKSTITRLGEALGWKALGDDLNLLTVRDGRASVAAVPRAEELRRGVRQGPPMPLGAICRLRKGDNDDLVPITAAEAHGVLLSCCPYLNRDRHRSSLIEPLLDAVVARYPAYELRFSLEGQLQGLHQILANPEGVG